MMGKEGKCTTRDRPLVGGGEIVNDWVSKLTTGEELDLRDWEGIIMEVCNEEIGLT